MQHGGKAPSCRVLRRTGSGSRGPCLGPRALQWPTPLTEATAEVALGADLALTSAPFASSNADRDISPVTNSKGLTASWCSATLVAKGVARAQPDGASKSRRRR
jgi:hypothetical protein